jgi:hypothetical protein
MKNLVLSILFLCCAGAVTLLAADPWQKKPFTAWNDQDVQAVLKDSPWAHELAILIKGRADDIRDNNPAGGGGGGGGGMGGPGGGGGDRGSLTNSLTVRFVSALPVRQAMARQKFGDQVGTSPVVAKNLSTPDNYYVVGIEGHVPPGDPKDIKAKSALKVGKGKDSITPADVRLENGMIVLFFPREGHPITVEDGEVEVQLALPGQAGPLKRGFKLKNMVYNGKLEL